MLKFLSCYRTEISFHFYTLCEIPNLYAIDKNKSMHESVKIKTIFLHLARMKIKQLNFAVLFGFLIVIKIILVVLTVKLLSFDSLRKPFGLSHEYRPKSYQSLRVICELRRSSISNLKNTIKYLLEQLIHSHVWKTTTNPRYTR